MSITRRAAILITLMLAGEAVFILPFVISRIFRPTFLKVFDINNLELGLAFSAYGWVAVLAYFFGGPIADRYSARNLLFGSLVITGFSGFIMAQIPNLFTLTLLYGFWGLSTILLFWSACMKSIRLYGGQENQGMAYGIVDGGRGLFAALLGTASVIVFDYFLGIPAEEASLNILTKALQQIIFMMSVLILIVALLLLIVFPKKDPEKTRMSAISLVGIREASKRKTVWWQSLIVICAYIGYKSTDDFSLYASEAFGFNDVNAAHVGTVSFWMRPLAALLAGYLGDRIIHSKVTGYCFLIMLVGSLAIFSGLLTVGTTGWVLLNIAGVSLGIYGLRGLYYALFQEAKLPYLITGSAVGLVSVIGYTPDIFFGPLMGYVLDESPGSLGHQYVFGIVAGFALVGYIASHIFRREAKDQ